MIGEKESLPTFNLIRGVAAILVCLFHFTSNSRLNYPSILNKVVEHGYTGVQVFFVLSGFVIPYSMYKGNYSLSKISTYLLKRISRIHPPYLASILLVLLLNYVFNISPYYSTDLIEVDAQGLFSHFLYLSNILGIDWYNSFYWSLAIEIQFYILMSLLYSFVVNRSVIWIFFAVVLISLGYFFSSSIFIFTHLPFFIAGIMVFRLAVKKDSIGVFLLSISANFIVLFIYSENIHVILASLTSVVLILVFKSRSKIGEFLGNISYSIYLIHIPVGQIIIRIGVDYTSGIYSEILLVVISLALTIVSSYIFYRLVEKPSKKLAQHFSYS